MNTFRVFCDFDGTVAQKDIGKELFSHFAEEVADTIAQRYINGEITARECLLSEAAGVTNCTLGEIAAFLDQFEIDGHFAQFNSFCMTHHVPLTILSDGLDFYVERILRRNNLEQCSFFGNHLEFRQDATGMKLDISFPFTDSECHFCGNCKRNHMLTQSGDEDIIVYVGDGISDRCPIHFADIVFAKKELIRYCQEDNISYHEFSNFGDVQRRLESMIGNKRIRKRREAEMARKDVFMQG